MYHIYMLIDLFFPPEEALYFYVWQLYDTTGCMPLLSVSEVLAGIGTFDIPPSVRIRHLEGVRCQAGRIPQVSQRRAAHDGPAVPTQPPHQRNPK